jgi:hypothetical protein
VPGYVDRLDGPIVGATGTGAIVDFQSDAYSCRTGSPVPHVFNASDTCKTPNPLMDNEISVTVDDLPAPPPESSLWTSYPFGPKMDFVFSSVGPTLGDIRPAPDYMSVRLSWTQGLAWAYHGEPHGIMACKFPGSGVNACGDLHMYGARLAAGVSGPAAGEATFLQMSQQAQGIFNEPVVGLVTLGDGGSLLFDDNTHEVYPTSGPNPAHQRAIGITGRDGFWVPGAPRWTDIVWQPESGGQRDPATSEPLLTLADVLWEYGEISSLSFLLEPTLGGAWNKVNGNTTAMTFGAEFAVSLYWFSPADAPVPPEGDVALGPAKRGVRRRRRGLLGGMTIMQRITPSIA